MIIVKRKALDGWRWRCIHANGNIMAESGEAYDREAGADNALRTLRTYFGTAPVYRANGLGSLERDTDFDKPINALRI